MLCSARTPLSYALLLFCVCSIYYICYTMTMTMMMMMMITMMRRSCVYLNFYIIFLLFRLNCCLIFILTRTVERKERESIKGMVNCCIALLYYQHTITIFFVDFDFALFLSLSLYATHTIHMQLFIINSLAHSLSRSFVSPVS